MAFIETVALSYVGDDCLLWPFYRRGRDGYGVLKSNVDAHRYVCRAAHGEPAGDANEAAHECGVRACVNPRHLSWKTHKQNLADRKKHGTLPQGETHLSAKLTATQVRAIRAKKGLVPAKAVAAEYGVVVSNIRKIWRGKSWRDHQIASEH